VEHSCWSPTVHEKTIRKNERDRIKKNENKKETNKNKTSKQETKKICVYR
jgi:hypothetical protein